MVCAWSSIKQSRFSNYFIIKFNTFHEFRTLQYYCIVRGIPGYCAELVFARGKSFLLVMPRTPRKKEIDDVPSADEAEGVYVVEKIMGKRQIRGVCRVYFSASNSL